MNPLLLFQRIIISQRLLLEDSAQKAVKDAETNQQYFESVSILHYGSSPSAEAGAIG